MKNLVSVFSILTVFLGHISIAQDSTGLAGTKVNEVQTSGVSSPFLFDEWFSGAVTTKDGQVYDGVKFRYDTSNDQLEFKKGEDTYRTGSDVAAFSLPTGDALYNFKNGFPAVGKETEQSFYQVLYDGNVKLLKRFRPTGNNTSIVNGGKLYILKNEKMNPVSLSDRNSFLKVLADQKNKMNYVIKESLLDFDQDEDLVTLLEEYDSYVAGKGGN